MAAFPEPPRLGPEWGSGVWQVLQRWMSDLKRWQQAGGGTGTVTSITGTTPIVVTPSPLTTVGVVSHAASGVAAATYGDASNYPIVTVDAKGHVTAASVQAASSGGAPVGASYVVMALDGTLTSERRLQVTGAATLTDGGANADATINVPGAGSAGSQFNWGKFIAGRWAWPAG